MCLLHLVFVVLVLGILAEKKVATVRPVFAAIRFLRRLATTFGLQSNSCCVTACFVCPGRKLFVYSVNRVCCISFSLRCGQNLLVYSPARFVIVSVSVIGHVSLVHTTEFFRTVQPP